MWKGQGLGACLGNIACYPVRRGLKALWGAAMMKQIRFNQLIWWRWLNIVNISSKNTVWICLDHPNWYKILSSNLHQHCGMSLLCCDRGGIATGGRMWGCCECMQERPLPTLSAVLSILKVGHHGRKLSKSPQRVSTHRDHLRPILGISLDFAGGEDAITPVEWCITCQNFCIKCRWTLFAWMLFLPSPVHWGIESIKEYHFDLSLLPQTSSCTGPPLKGFGWGMMGPNKWKNLPRAFFFRRQASFLGVCAWSRQLWFTFGGQTSFHHGWQVVTGSKPLQSWKRCWRRRLAHWDFFLEQLYRYNYIEFCNHNLEHNDSLTWLFHIKLVDHGQSLQFPLCQEATPDEISYNAAIVACGKKSWENAIGVFDRTMSRCHGVSNVPFFFGGGGFCFGCGLGFPWFLHHYWIVPSLQDVYRAYPTRHNQLWLDHARLWGKWAVGTSAGYFSGVTCPWRQAVIIDKLKVDNVEQQVRWCSLIRSFYSL